MRRDGGNRAAETAQRANTARGLAPRGTPAAVPESLVRPRVAAPVYDVIILGAGCAGLSSCLALLDAGADGPILLIDSRCEYRDDRTWCFWDVESTPFTHLARSRWTTWQVRTADSVVQATAQGTPYLCLAANDFYAFALASIAAHGNVELRLGERAGDIRECGGSAGAGVQSHEAERDRGERAGLVEVTTESGTFWAREVVDSRGLSLASPEASAARSRSTWVPQQFVGLHIVADRPVFDPGECRLMDFGVDQSEGLRFMYVLPASPFEALVENVYMCERRLDAEGYRREIDAYLLAEFSLAEGDYEVIGEERGYIPMTDHRFVRRRSPHVTALGVLGGATRPSTGYTFLGIQRASRELVDRLARNAQIVAAPRLAGVGADDAFADGADGRAPACSLLDAVFLRFLADNPGRAPHVFGLLFGRVETGSLVRFLTERSGVLDHARLILALPKLPFLAAAARVLTESRRRDPGGLPRARRR